MKRPLIESLQRVLLYNDPLIRSFKCNIEFATADQLKNLKLIINADRVPRGEHRGRYYAPTIDEAAVLLVDEDKGPRDIALRSRSGQLQLVSEFHRSYDALQYPLMFIKGENDYRINILLQR